MGFLERVDGRFTDLLSSAIYRFKKGKIETADRQLGKVVGTNFRRGEVIVQKASGSIEVFPGRYVADINAGLPYKKVPLGKPLSAREIGRGE